MRHTLLMLALLTACGTDADGDGFPLEEDCNDADADINPDATEVCDGVDNNCDGSTDEGVTTTFYTDQDRDGFGDPNAPVEACEAGIGQVVDNTDCNDESDEAFPGNDETCADEIDNNCDGEINENSAIDATTWFPDTDGDGFGADEGSRVSCDPGDGWAADGGDCADDDKDVNPGADELCGDEIDNDCKNGVDDAGAIDAAKWHEDGDNDAYGNPDMSQRACLQPEGWVSDDTDCDDEDRRENPDATWYVDTDGDLFGAQGSMGNACERVNETDADNDGDCDDSDKEINPDATEVWYDDVDQDCSGGSDFDQDGDGYESTDEADGEDCDDNNPSVNPMEAEIEDGIDNNCDDLCDEGYISRGDLIITEIMQNPAQVDDSLGEWFEVYNDSGSDLTICGGWSLLDSDSDDYEISGGPYTVAKDSYMIFGAESDSSKNGGVTVDVEFDRSDFQLANSDDEIIIFFDSTTIDKLGYDGGTDWPDPVGSSMNLDPDFRDETDNDDGENWCATDSSSFGSGDLGTPGKANEECPEES